MKKQKKAIMKDITRGDKGAVKVLHTQSTIAIMASRKMLENETRVTRSYSTVHS